MKKLNKIILIALFFITILSIANITYAISNPYIFHPEPTGDNSKIGGIISKVLGIITVFGIIIAVGGIMIIGIQTMYGSAQEKSIYKQKMIPFIVGFVILISIVSIVSIIEKVSNGLFTQTEQTSPETPPPWDPNPTPAP